MVLRIITGLAYNISIPMDFGPSLFAINILFILAIKETWVGKFSSTCASAKAMK